MRVRRYVFGVLVVIAVTSIVLHIIGRPSPVEALEREWQMSMGETRLYWLSPKLTVDEKDAVWVSVNLVDALNTDTWRCRQGVLAHYETCGRLVLTDESPCNVYNTCPSRTPEVGLYVIGEDSLCSVSPKGKTIWSTEVWGPPTHYWKCSAVVADGSSIYVAGNVFDRPYEEPIIAAFDQDGARLWSRMLRGLKTGYGPYVSGVDIDGHGRVVLGSAGSSESHILFLSNSGEVLHHRRTMSVLESLRVGGDGVYVLGRTESLKEPSIVERLRRLMRLHPKPTGQRPTMARLDYYRMDGSIVWTRFCEACLPPLAVDASGNAYTLGTVSDGKRVVQTVTKWNPKGRVVWRYSVPSESDRKYTDLMIDSKGDILTSGTVGREPQAFVMKLKQPARPYR